MKRRMFPLGALLLAGVLAVAVVTPAAALDRSGEPAGAAAAQGPTLQVGNGIDAPDEITRAMWAIVGIVIMVVVAGIFYLFKRRVGGFPEDPEWVAPISIMRAGENPVDVDDYPPPPSDHH